MKLSTIIKIGFATLAASASFSAFAIDQVVCPAGDMVKKAVDALNTVSIVNKATGQYATLTNKPAVSTKRFEWHVMSIATAKDFNTAFETGQKNVGAVTAPSSKYAVDAGQFFYCMYDNNVFGLAMKKQRTSIDMITLDLPALLS
jgi:hypothetical protein